MKVTCKFKTDQRKTRALLGLLFLVILWWPKQLSAQAQFTPVATNIPQYNATSHAWGDFDNDNDLDILIAGMNGGYFTRIYRNDNGVFTDIVAGLPGTIYGSVAWGDYDNDGDLDVLLAGDSMLGLISRIYRNDNGVFVDINAGLRGIENGSVAWGDYDNDGDLDIVIVGFLDVSKVYRNDGGTFVDINANLEFVDNSDVAWADYDKDGDLDLILSGFASTNLGYRISWIYRNDNGTFVKINSSILGMSNSSIAWGDYDNDGDLDILISGGSSGVTTKIYRNTNGTFADLAAGLAGIAAGEVAWGDYDNDGDLDVLLCGNFGASSIARVFQNNGGSFTDIGAGLDGAFYSSAAWGDYDNDGDLDILISGQPNDPAIIATRIYRNNSIIANTAPNAVSGLVSATIQPNKVALRWNRASDGQTPKKGLSYNLRIGTSPGSGNILASQANDSNGFRKIARIGSVQDTAYFVNLPAGNYYWSVQAIDAGLMGGVWATEQTFTVATTCQGDSVVLSAGTTPPGATYQWLKDGVLVAGATNATFGATATGSYAVNVTSGATSNTGAATLVIVKPLPVAPAITAGGATTFCAGDSVTLTAATTTAGASYQWFHNANAIAGANAATYRAKAAGLYTAVAIANGCSSVVSPATIITVIPAPAIPAISASGTSFNVGGSVTLTAVSATPNATFQWFRNGTVIAGATLASYNVTVWGNYTVVATAAGCTSDPSAAVYITANPTPVTPVITQNGGVLTSSSATGNQWYFNGAPIPGATGQTYVATANGSYTLRVTINGYASLFSAAVYVANTGISAGLAGMSVEIYPNPASGFFNVKLNGYQKAVTILLYNLAGQQLLTLNATPTGKAQRIALNDLAAGTYLLKVISEKGVQVSRLVVE